MPRACSVWQYRAARPRALQPGQQHSLQRGGRAPFQLWGSPCLTPELPQREVTLGLGRLQGPQQQLPGVQRDDVPGLCRERQRRKSPGSFWPGPEGRWLVHGVWSRLERPC